MDYYLNTPASKSTLCISLGILGVSTIIYIMKQRHKVNVNFGKEKETLKEVEKYVTDDFLDNIINHGVDLTDSRYYQRYNNSELQGKPATIGATMWNIKKNFQEEFAKKFNSSKEHRGISIIPDQAGNFPLTTTKRPKNGLENSFGYHVTNPPIDESTHGYNIPPVKGLMGIQYKQK